jgi:hypothetical protein
MPYIEITASCFPSLSSQMNNSIYKFETRGADQGVVAQ